MIPNNKTRKLLESLNITYETLTSKNIIDLKNTLDMHLKKSNIYNGTAKIDKLKNSRFLTISTNQWKSREAISFNTDGFIGFCGWADSKNTKIILDAVEEWALNIAKDKKNE